LKVAVIEAPQESRLLDTVDPDRNFLPVLGVFGVQIDETNVHTLPGLRVPSGVVVTGRAPDSQATDSPLLAGDVIHAMNGIVVATLDGLRSTLGRLKRHSAVVLQIERAGKLMFVAFQSN